ncbi:hypothetical protein COCNU_05G003970 [Cocos nucifera]|uniref:Uncharacterized protein n=1 Tax=Cocos nucifera TaxID=13894 RepID=A0A8K0I8A3_COCNU|nr:hypothetical protein COCNU_05G003970 [Cocos nucifera]
MKHLKEVLEIAEATRAKVEADKASKNKRRKMIEAKVAKAKKKAECQIMEVEGLTVEAFKTSLEFTEIKVQFDREAFEAWQEVCHQKIADRHSKWDLSFLDDEEGDDPPMVVEPSTVEEPLSGLVADEVCLETLEKDASRAKKNAAEAERKLLKMKKSYEEVLVEIKYWRSTI